jgi:hypothetical protein
VITDLFTREASTGGSDNPLAGELQEIVARLILGLNRFIFYKVALHVCLQQKHRCAQSDRCEPKSRDFQFCESCCELNGANRLINAKLISSQNIRSISSRTILCKTWCVRCLLLEKLTPRI